MEIPCDVNLKCCGIYLIRNDVNNKVYIGLSNNIYRRWNEHKRSGLPDKYSIKSLRDSLTPIHLAMQKYGIDHFHIEILELTSKLDEREKYWIKKFKSNNKDIGYNILSGGLDNIALCGEQHSLAKLTLKLVNEIKEILRTSDLTFTEINKKYNISKPTISMINQGKIWKDKNESYPLRKTYYGSKGEKNPRSKFTELQVLEIRTLYSKGITLKDMPLKYKDIASESAINAILSGKTYKHLPIWNKKTQQWI